MTQYHNVDMTIAAENGKTKEDIKAALRWAIDHDEKLEELVMISKIKEVEQK